MTDVVVTVNRAAKLPELGKSWRTVVGHTRRLLVEVGDRLYVIHRGRLWGYGEIAMVNPRGKVTTILGCGAPRRCAINCKIRLFTGHRYRWWDRVAEEDADT
jgi:hypothetical protein